MMIFVLGDMEYVCCIMVYAVCLWDFLKLSDCISSLFLNMVLWDGLLCFGISNVKCHVGTEPAYSDTSGIIFLVLQYLHTCLKTT